MTQSQSPARHESDKFRARRLLEEVVNQRRFDCLAELVAPDCIWQQADTRGPEGFREHAETMLLLYPDLQVSVDGQVAEGEIVVTWFTAIGTHQGEWQGIRPTHRQLRLKGVNVQRFRNGRVVEHWGGSNSLEALLEMGLVRWQGGDGPE